MDSWLRVHHSQASFPGEAFLAPKVRNLICGSSRAGGGEVSRTGAYRPHPAAANHSPTTQEEGTSLFRSPTREEFRPKAQREGRWIVE